MAHLRVIRSQVGRMRRLVDDLLDVSRIDRRGGVSIEPVDFDLADEVRAAVERVAREHGDRTIGVEVQGTLPVHADRDRIDQVLSNLLENAVKYSPDGGTIRVGYDRVGRRLRFRVADEGIGIPLDESERIFEKFYRLDPELLRGVGGTGLGLYISRELADRMQGSIWVDSIFGEGSTFYFELPLADGVEQMPGRLEGRPGGVLVDQ
jgi:two-component system, OmpR family, sensor histidine kinase VicK